MTWQFEAADSLFFGPGKPMNAGESAWIDAQFPPTGVTLQGAVRTAVLYHCNADIAVFVKGHDCLPDGSGSLKDEIGCAESMGKLKLTGPFLQRNVELLFPVPLDFMRDSQGKSALLKPGAPVCCDLGYVRLPDINAKGYKTREGYYVSEEGMAKLLSAKPGGFANDAIIPLLADNPGVPALADKEPKIGLARDNRSRTTSEGMLFAIAPVRPRAEVSLLLRVEGIGANRIPPGAFLQKLGGEGKLARIQVCATPIKMPFAQLTLDGERLRFKLVFTQPALLPVDGWLPEGFQKTKKDNVDLWTGELNGCAVDIVSACIGKPLKIGGWDLQKHCSKPHRAYIPAGSVYFCEAAATDRAQIEKLHDSKLGQDTEYGFGHVLVGKW